MEFSSEAISSSPEMIKEMHRECISGWGRSEKGLFVILDLQKLLNKEEIDAIQKINPPLL